MSPTLDEVFNPRRPAGAYEDLRSRVLPTATAQRSWQPEDGPLPALFVSHGAPPTLDDPEWLADLFAWSQTMPKPRAIVVVSAHWEDAPLSITSPAAGTPLYYDFGGFHPHYYTLKYSTPDAGDLARRVATAFNSVTPVHQHHARGLDHGAFIPLMAMYPAADVPVVQLSMPNLHPDVLLEVGRRLQPLRAEGILLIGSGFMTHSFAVMRDPRLTAHTQAFDEWASDALTRSDVDALADYRAKAPGSAVAHPTADHFVPLLFTLGAVDGTIGTLTTAIDDSRFGNSIRSIAVS